MSGAFHRFARPIPELGPDSHRRSLQTALEAPGAESEGNPRAKPDKGTLRAPQYGISGRRRIREAMGLAQWELGE